MNDKGTVTVDLAEWIGKAAWARATDAARRGATDLAVAKLLGAKRRQVLAGRGADGAPMARRKHARRDGATGPVLAPHRVESRSMTRLRHSKVGSGRIVIWWGDGWSRVLSYHGRGLVRHAPVRNVVDFTPGALARIRRKVLAWWGANGEEGVRVGPPAPPPPPVPKPKPKPPPAAVPKPPPPPPGKPDLRDLIKGKSDPAEVRSIVLDYVRMHQSPVAVPIKEHGMTHAEQLHSVEWEGLTWKGPAAGGDRDNPVVRSIHYMLDPNLARGGEIPREIARHTKEIIFSAQRNNQDGYWESAYNTPGFQALGTGGGGKVVVYNGKPIDPNTLAHEMGHNVATAKYGSIHPTATSDFAAAAATKEPVVSDYARNSTSEDFAESIRVYYESPALLQVLHPRRFAVIDRLMKDPNYGG